MRFILTIMLGLGLGTVAVAQDVVPPASNTINLEEMSDAFTAKQEVLFPGVALSEAEMQETLGADDCTYIPLWGGGGYWVPAGCPH